MKCDDVECELWRSPPVLVSFTSTEKDMVKYGGSTTGGDRPRCVASEPLFQRRMLFLELSNPWLIWGFLSKSFQTIIGAADGS